MHINSVHKYLNYNHCNSTQTDSSGFIWLYIPEKNLKALTMKCIIF
jgi:hypothetical protein